ncbi:MAG: hypothetical protein C4562_03340 [Actinobacteria bacterium]|nr:MAG: hypothetical protein C4562_03340 [Actinomycetota bacterium]
MAFKSIVTIGAKDLQKKTTIIPALLILLSTLIITSCIQRVVTKNFKTYQTLETKGCSSCHPFNKKEPYSDYKFSHVRHFKKTKARNCKDCHQEKEHGKEAKKGFLSLRIEACRLCHNENLHGNSWSGSKGSRKTHGQEANRNITSCMTCHKPIFCRSCHQVDIPHDQNTWVSKHGKWVTTFGISKCRTCHGGKADKESLSYCFTCHVVPMPHPSSWKKEHGSKTKSIGKQSCWQCHNEELFCNECHHTTMPHAGDFKKSHYKSLEEKKLASSICVQCHNNNTASTQGCFGGECHTQKISH